MFEYPTDPSAPREFVRFRYGVNGVNCIRTPKVPHNPYAMGYGKRIPTQYMVRVFNQRWHRVYCVCYSNIGTCYVTIKGKNYIVEID